MHVSSEYENVHLQSRWSIGLKTPLLMVGSFILAFLVAALHAIFYQVLAGTPTDGPESRVPQTYETTISVILSSTFTLLIHFCLGLSFTQYLWFILRRQPLATSAIEHIFTLRSNPLSLFDRTVFRRARPLVMVAIIYWSASIAMSFPPGAITVVPSLKQIIVRDAVVPTFNASDFGDMTPSSFQEKSLFQLSLGYTTLEEDQDPRLGITFVLDYNLKPALHGMIHQTLLRKHVEDTSSTCSANCSYTLRFTGPYVQCNGTTNTSTLLYHDLQWGNYERFPIFNSSTDQRSIGYDSVDDPKFKDPPLRSSIQISTSSPQNFGAKELGPSGNYSTAQCKIGMINHYWNCIPSRADYAVHTAYKNNVRSLEVNIDETSIKPLIPAPPSFIDVWRGQEWPEPLHLNATVAAILRDANLYSIITPVMKTIEGSFDATCGEFWNATSIYSDSAGFEYYNFTTTFPPNDTSSQNSTDDFMTILPIAQYFSDAIISPSFSNISVNNGGLFTINERRINAMLQDVVLSMISYQPNNWTTRVDQTRNEIRTIYSFSRPFNLFLPYGLILLGSLCTMVFGFYALRSNGVPATDGGFLQLFTTAHRSDTVDRIARGGCLGGEENISTTLKDLKIQFGELIKATDGPEIELFSTAGFGTEHEVRPLKRERIYGSL